MSLISVIIPCYNRANVISKAIDSVVNQTEGKWELIIVDDGSTDDSKQVISSYLMDSRIHYFYQDNKGVSAARNFGVLNATGNYIIFLDTDDYFYPKALEKYTDKINSNKEIQICFSNYLSEEKIKGLKKNEELFGEYTVSNIPGSFCFKKEFFQKIGGYTEGASHSENWELMIRAINSSLFNKTVAIIEEPLMYYHQWKDKSKIIKNKKNKIKSYKLFFDKSKKKSFLSAYYSHQIAINYAGLGFFWRTINWTFLSVKNSNSKFKYLVKPILIYIKRKIIKYK
jgi:glycosyltransferase involved in cell wall biosynthesis